MLIYVRYLVPVSLNNHLATLNKAKLGMKCTPYLPICPQNRYHLVPSYCGLPLFKCLICMWSTGDQGSLLEPSFLRFLKIEIYFASILIIHLEVKELSIFVKYGIIYCERDRLQRTSFLGSNLQRKKTKSTERAMVLW